ncbi:MAG: acyloxyacyl hydrolase [Woeseiaceae bacterium]
MSKLQSSLAVVLCAILFASPARADITLTSIGILEADSVKKFSGLRQHGLLLSYRVNTVSRGFWVPSKLDFTAGHLERGSDSALFVSFGPTYRFNMNKNAPGRWFVDIGSHPTYVSKSQFGGKPLGGKFFFTSFLGLGAYLDRQRHTCLLLRYQHTSNAGLSNSNPGVDMLGLSFSYHFGADQQLFSAVQDEQK